MSSWESAYRSVESLWGFKPDHVLLEYASVVPKGKILDLGVGEGRNALFFAKRGFEVEGFDISPTAVERVMENAKKANVKVKAEVGNLKEMVIPKETYSLIIAAWVLNFFKKSELEEIINKIKDGLKKDGFVYVGVFSLDDPGYERAKERFEKVEKHTFFSPRIASFIHYFAKEEVLSLFSGLKVVYCAEGTALDFQHGEPHSHGFVEYIGQKNSV